MRPAALRRWPGSLSSMASRRRASNSCSSEQARGTVGTRGDTRWRSSSKKSCAARADSSFTDVDIDSSKWAFPAKGTEKALGGHYSAPSAGCSRLHGHLHNYEEAE